MARLVGLHVLRFQPERGPSLGFLVQRECDANDFRQRSAIRVRDHAAEIYKRTTASEPTEASAE
jgi:hypothetical protein